MESTKPLKPRPIRELQKLHVSLWRTEERVRYWPALVSAEGLRNAQATEGR